MPGLGSVKVQVRRNLHMPLRLEKSSKLMLLLLPLRKAKSQRLSGPLSEERQSIQTLSPWVSLQDLSQDYSKLAMLVATCG